MVNQKEQILDTIASRISQSVGVPVFVMNTDTIRQIMDAISQDQQIRDNFSHEQLFSEVSHFYQFLIIKPPATDEELAERVENFITELKTEKEYRAIIILKGLFGIPIGKSIGKLKIIDYNSEVEHLKN